MMRISKSSLYDTVTAQALRDVYDAAWGKRINEGEIYERVAVPMPASSSSDASSSETYTATFLRLAGIEYFTQLVRAENHTVLKAVEEAIARVTPLNYGSSIVCGQAGVGKSMCLRFALVERLLDRRPTIYLDEAARVLALYTASGCRVWRVDPTGKLCELQSPQVWRLLHHWAGDDDNVSDPVAADLWAGDPQTTAALIDSDPGRPHPPPWLVARGNPWANVQATSSPPLDYIINNAWACQNRADRIWMDTWSWPEVYAACLHLYQFDVERLERARQIFYSATPSLEHCVEFSLSVTTVQELRRQVTELAVSFVESPNGLYLAPVLIDQTDSPRREQDRRSHSLFDPPEDLASVGTESVRATWLYGVPERDHKDSGSTSFVNVSPERVVRPFIMFPRRVDAPGYSIARYSAARLELSGSDVRSAIRRELAREIAKGYRTVTRFHALWQVNSDVSAPSVN